jgi:hypothetical protein
MRNVTGTERYCDEPVNTAPETAPHLHHPALRGGSRAPRLASPQGLVQNRMVRTSGCIWCALEERMPLFRKKKTLTGLARTCG